MLSILIFKYVSGFLKFVNDVFPIPDIPSWFLTGWNYILSAMSQGVHLLSWLFPSENVYTAFCGLCLDTFTIVMTMKFYRWLTRTKGELSI